VTGHQVAEHVESRGTHRGEVGAGRRREVPAGQRGHLGQERAPELVVLQRAVPAGAPHRAAPAAVEERLSAVTRRIGDLGHAVVDLVAGHRRAQRAAARASEDLGRAEPDAHRQQPEAVDETAARLHVVFYLAGHHLVAAADAQHGTAGPSPLDDRAGEPALPQPGQVGDGSTGAGQHHQIRVGQVGRAGREPHQHAGFGRQGVHVGEVTDPGQPDHRNPEKIFGTKRRGHGALREIQRVLGV
jgi:hypothetical protein